MTNKGLRPLNMYRVRSLFEPSLLYRLGNSLTSPAKIFQQLCDEAGACRFCPRLADQPAVLSPRNGPITSEVVFIAEAPGRFGAGRTGIPFSGDRSGENFEVLLEHAGLTRKEVFITNAALCNPLENGNNSRPTTREIRNCSYYLQAVLEIIQPKIIVTLGGVGLQAMNLLLNTKFQLKRDAAKWQKIRAPLKTDCGHERSLGNKGQRVAGWGNVKLLEASLKLLPLYHPSPRVTNWQRPLQQQKRDFRKITQALRKLRSGL